MAGALKQEGRDLDSSTLAFPQEGFELVVFWLSNILLKIPHKRLGTFKKWPMAAKKGNIWGLKKRSEEVVMKLSDH